MMEMETIKKDGKEGARRATGIPSFSPAKQERVHWRHYQTRYEAQQDILNYITMFYNSIRLHSYLGYKSPNQYEVEMSELEKVA